MASPATALSIRAWKPPIRGIREVFHARFADHAYPPHTHDAWTLFIVDEGAIRYDLDRHARGAEPAMVTVLPPHVVHDGRTATSHGFSNRVLYLETGVLGAHLIGRAVDRPIILDRSLRDEVSALHDKLGCIDDVLEAETRLEVVAERIRAHLGEPAVEPPAVPGRDLAENLRGFLDVHVFEPVTMAAATEQIGASPTQLARAFATVFGIAPHVYVVGRRLDAARDRILAGQPLADVAVEVGFYDQAHMSRRFKKYLGTTPGRFAQSRSGRAGIDELVATIAAPPKSKSGPVAAEWSPETKDRREMTPTLFGKEHVDRYVETDGEVGHDWRNGAPTLILTTTGRHSGKPRSTPLIYGREGDNHLVVASKGGADVAPGWYLNLQANPDVQVQVKADRFTARARTATPEEKPELWQAMTAIWPDYDAYQRRTKRDIPVVILERV